MRVKEAFAVHLGVSLLGDAAVVLSGVNKSGHRCAAEG